MVVILADEEKNGAGAQLQEKLAGEGVQAEYIPLEGVKVQPCVSCGHCTKVELGRCATRDDGDWIYPKIASADALVIVSPVVFGGFSFKAKRVIDKFGLIMDSHYFVKDGEMVKGGLIGRQFRYYALGMGALAEGEAEAFEHLVRETIWIVRGRGGAFFTGSPADPAVLDKVVQEVQSA
jgi:multimeric flavodoxin WrbA